MQACIHPASSPSQSHYVRDPSPRILCPPLPASKDSVSRSCSFLLCAADQFPPSTATRNLSAVQTTTSGMWHGSKQHSQSVAGAADFLHKKNVSRDISHGDFSGQVSRTYLHCITCNSIYTGKGLLFLLHFVQLKILQY